LHYKRHEFYLKKIKNGDLGFFFKFSKKKNNHLVIPAYEEKIQQVAIGKLNICFFDFIMYLFFKINMLEKKKEDILRLKKRRRQQEMIYNYPLKIERLISLLKKFININLSLNEKKKKSIKGFLFFLIFIMELLFKIKKNRFNFKLRDLNLRLIRLLFFNRVFSKLGSFFGRFMSHILYLLTNIKNYNFRFCLLSNSSLNAKFLARYIGFKLKRKFPLFFVINPIKKELKKLSFEKREYKFNLLNLNNKKKLISIKNEYKVGFKNILLYLYNKYIPLFIFYYKKYKTFILFDLYIFFLLLKKKI
jgi:hypothetical protein